MRKLAMLSLALIGLAFANPTFAQSGESAPQPGLPRGASVGTPNAQPPSATGDVATTTPPPTPKLPPRRHRVRPVRPARPAATAPTHS